MDKFCKYRKTSLRQLEKLGWQRIRKEKRRRKKQKQKRTGWSDRPKIEREKQERMKQRIQRRPQNQDSKTQLL